MEQAKSSDPAKYLTKFPRLMELDYRSCKTYALERESVLKAWKAAEVEMTDKQKVQSSHLASFDPSLLRSICKYDEYLRHVSNPTNEDLENWLLRQLQSVEKDLVPSDLRAFSHRLREYAGKAELRYGRKAFVTLAPILRAFDGAVEDFGLQALVEAKAKHVMEAWSKAVLDTISPSAAKTYVQDRLKLHDDHKLHLKQVKYIDHVCQILDLWCAGRSHEEITRLREQDKEKAKKKADSASKVNPRDSRVKGGPKTTDREDKPTNTKKGDKKDYEDFLAKAICDNCGEKGHLVPACTKPRDEEKIKAAVEKRKKEKL